MSFAALGTCFQGDSANSINKSKENGNGKRQVDIQDTEVVRAEETGGHEVKTVSAICSMQDDEGVCTR